MKSTTQSKKRQEEKLKRVVDIQRAYAESSRVVSLKTAENIAVMTRPQSHQAIDVDALTRKSRRAGVRGGAVADSTAKSRNILSRFISNDSVDSWPN
jgi:hypothetical protein